MNRALLSRVVHFLPLFAPLLCVAAPPPDGAPAGPAKEQSPAAVAGDVPPASISPPLDNDTNPPMVAKDATGTLGSIQRLDPALDELIAPDAKIEVIVKGVDWAEGPVWWAGGLFFSDVPQNTLYRWTPKAGVHPYLKPSGYTGAAPRGGQPGSNGLTIDLQGRLTMCQHGDRRVVRLEKDGKTVTVLADRYHGKRLSSPNDLCFASNGTLYFTDPPYGLDGADESPAKEQDANGLYMLHPGGELVRTNTGTIEYPDGKSGPVHFPNGLALSPDEKVMYIGVSDSDHPVILKYDVKPDGDLANGKVFFDAAPLAAQKLPGPPDGLKIDTRGNLWATGPGGVLVITPQGKHLGTVMTNINSGNCAWGDDGSTLYICANHEVCRVKTRAHGIMPGPRQ